MPQNQPEVKSYTLVVNKRTGPVSSCGIGGGGKLFHLSRKGKMVRGNREKGDSSTVSVFLVPL